MRPMVEQSLSHLVMALQDPSVAVRDFVEDIESLETPPSWDGIRSQGTLKWDIVR